MLRVDYLIIKNRKEISWFITNQNIILILRPKFEEEQIFIIKWQEKEHLQ